MVLDDFSALGDLIDQTAMPQVRRFNVKLVGREQVTARVQLYLPPGLREDEITTYPMIVEV